MTLFAGWALFQNAAASDHSEEVIPFISGRVIVKCCVTHPDHANVTFDIWHEVVPNTESGAIAFRDVAFLDWQTDLASEEPRELV